MSNLPDPTAQTVALSAHAVEQYQRRIKPGLDLDAARGELERLRAMGDISPHPPTGSQPPRPRRTTC